MTLFANNADARAMESAQPYHERNKVKTIYELLSNAARDYSDERAVSFQIFSDPNAVAETLTWRDMKARITQTANLFRRMGIGEKDAVAIILPNCNEAVIAILAGMVAGIAAPINPLLETAQIAALLRGTKARLVVTLKSFPQADTAQKVAEAVKHAPNVHAVLEVDLIHYLNGIKRFATRFIRPKNPGAAYHHAEISSFYRRTKKQFSDRLEFEDKSEDRIAACFHTGGSTGLPKLAYHTMSGIIYNGWMGHTLLFERGDNVMCPLPLFHVFCCYPVMISMIFSGAHIIFPTPQGFRGAGVIDNFWKLLERWKVTFVITVPTAISALMQKPVNADISTMKHTMAGSSSMPVELYRRFEKATGVQVVEGYGLTEASCLVSCNPVEGPKRVGSVGFPFPYTKVRILTHTEAGITECAQNEIGEICVSSPGVNKKSSHVVRDATRQFFDGEPYLRTGDLGRLDEDGYLWITGRAKDLIIRGGHNIDPAEIEEALLSHEAIACVGAIGQPDMHSGELPCAYVELVEGYETSVEELMTYAQRRVRERAAIPKHIEVLPEIPKTAVGKVFKPQLRKLAIARIFGAIFQEKGLAVAVGEIIEDRKRGLVARFEKNGPVDEKEFASLMDNFTQSWEWAPQEEDAAEKTNLVETE